MALTTILYGLVCSVLWGTTDIFTKKSVDRVGPYVNSFVFFFVMTLTAIPLFLFPQVTALGSISWTDVLIILGFGFADFVSLGLFFKAIQKGRVSILVPISSANAVIATLVSVIIFGEILTLPKFAILIMVIVGIVILSVDFKDLRNGLQAGDLVKGLPEILVATVIWGGYGPLLNQFYDRPDWEIMPFLIRTATTVMFGLMILVIYKGKLISKLRDFKATLFSSLGGITQGIGSNIFSVALVSTTSTSLLITTAATYPVTLVTLSYVFLKEKLAINQYVGIGIVVLGVILLGVV